MFVVFYDFLYFSCTAAVHSEIMLPKRSIDFLLGDKSDSVKSEAIDFDDNKNNNRELVPLLSTKSYSKSKPIQTENNKISRKLKSFDPLHSGK